MGSKWLAKSADMKSIYKKEKNNDEINKRKKKEEKRKVFRAFNSDKMKEKQFVSFDDQVRTLCTELSNSARPSRQTL